MQRGYVWIAGCFQLALSQNGRFVFRPSDSIYALSLSLSIYLVFAFPASLSSIMTKTLLLSALPSPGIIRHQSSRYSFGLLLLCHLGPNFSHLKKRGTHNVSGATTFHNLSLVHLHNKSQYIPGLCAGCSTVNGGKLSNS